MKKIIASTAAALLLAGGIVAVSGTAASAHTPRVSATCEAIEIAATSYDGTRPAQGTETIQVPNPDYVPGSDGTPAVGTPTIVVENPDYVPAKDAVFETVVTEREYKKWRLFFWEVQWFPADANPGGWTATGNVRTEQREVSPATPAVGTPTIEVPNPDYVPATEPTAPQGEPTIAAPNPDYVPASDAPNTVTATVDGVQVLSASFGGSYSNTITLEKYTAHDWTVTITGWNDPQGSHGWTKTYSDTTTPCAMPEQPDDVVTYTSEWSGEYACGDTTVTEYRSGTRATHTWSGTAWVETEGLTFVEQRTRDLTDEEIADLDCEVTPPTEEPEEPTTENPVDEPETPATGATVDQPKVTAAKAAPVAQQAESTETLATTGGQAAVGAIALAFAMIAAGVIATAIRRKRA